VRGYSDAVSVPALSSREVKLADSDEYLPGGKGFVVLSLREKGKLVSDNFYWLSQDGDFGFLASLPQANVRVSVKREFQDDHAVVRVRLNNTGSSPAFFIALRMERKEGGELLPSFWSDNYLTLLPGESREMSWTSDREISRRELLLLRLDGWNVPGQIVAVD
jgi:exo-1,4-beta-D-glucosaminidase